MLDAYDNKKVRELENERMREWVNIVSSFNFGKVLNFAKVWDEKAMCWDY